MKKHRKEPDVEEWEQLRAGLIFRTPQLFRDVLWYAGQIFDLINTYLPIKKYDVVKAGLNSIYSIVYKYIEVRQGTFFPSDPFFTPVTEADLSHDPFFNHIFEKLAAMQRIAAKDRDLELSKEILDCFAKIAINCVDIRYRVNTTNEHHHCMLAVQYLQQSIEDCLNVDLLDIGISSSLSLRDIGIFLIAKKDSTGIRMIINNLSKIAGYGIIKNNATFLISYPLQDYSVFIRAWIFSKEYYDKFLPKDIFEKVQMIIGMYLQYKEPPQGYPWMELQYSVGPFVDLSNKIAMPYVFDEAYNKIIDAKTEPKVRQVIIERIIELSDYVWHLYDELSKSAAKKESFLIHFIDANLHHIVITLLHFYKLDFVEEQQKKEIRKNIGWIISDYWRLYDYHEKITSTHEMQLMNNLLEIGTAFFDLKLMEEFESLLKIIVSIAGDFLEKQKDGYESVRILEKAFYLCILANSSILNERFVKHVNEVFWKQFISIHSQLKDLLFRELLSIDPDEFKFERYHITFEENLLARLNRDSVQQFVAYLKGKLDNV